MAFADKLKKLDAHRLQQSVKATVQSNGRLTFTVEATKEMGLSEEKSLIIFEADGGDLGAVISHKGDPDAFILKRCGLYFYVAFKNYLQQAGIDYKGQRIIYDITELDEKIDGKTLYQFARRVLPKAPEQLPISEVSNGSGNGDGTGDGRGSGSGAGNGDGSGDGSGIMPLEDNDNDIDESGESSQQYFLDQLDEEEETMPPPPPEAPPSIPLPKRPAPPAPSMPKMPRRPPPPPPAEETPAANEDWDMPF